jgi:hypothetical protein
LAILSDICLRTPRIRNDGGGVSGMVRSGAQLGQKWKIPPKFKIQTLVKLIDHTKVLQQFDKF